jgi:hypothetical protein
MGEGDKLIEIAYSEEKIFCPVPTRAAKAGQKYLVLAGQAKQSSPKVGPLQFVLFESPFTSVSTDSRGHLSLQPLC